MRHTDPQGTTKRQKSKNDDSTQRVQTQIIAHVQYQDKEKKKRGEDKTRKEKHDI